MRKFIDFMLSDEPASDRAIVVIVATVAAVYSVAITAAAYLATR